MHEDVAPQPEIPFLTRTLVGANILFFFLALSWQQTHGGDSWWDLNSLTLLRAGASVSLDWGLGDAWRLWCSMFLHLSWLHLGVNMYCLIGLDRLEIVLGRARFMVLYGISGLCGSLLSSGVHQEFMLSAGASGAIFGMFGALLVVSRGKLQRSVVTTILINAVFGFTVAGINNWAHLGGFLGGAICMLFLRSRPHSPAYPVTICLFAALTLWSGFRLAIPKSWSEYATRTYSIGPVQWKLPVFFRELKKDGVTYLQSPAVTLTCLPGAFPYFWAPTPPPESRLPSPAGDWWLQPVDPKNPRGQSALFSLGYQYLQVIAWAEQPRPFLQLAVEGVSLNAEQSRLGQVVARLRQGTIQSSELQSAKSLDEIMFLGELQLKEKKLEAAEKTARLGLAQAQGGNLEEAALSLLIRSLEENDLWQEALGPARRMVELNPQSATNHNWLAWILVHLKKYPEAKAQAEQALSLQPNDPGILDTYAAALLGLGELPEALATMEKVKKLAPPGTDTAMISKRFGEIWLAQGDKGKAKAAFREALKGTLPDYERREVENLLKH